MNKNFWIKNYRFILFLIFISVFSFLITFFVVLNKTNNQGGNNKAEVNEQKIVVSKNDEDAQTKENTEREKNEKIAIMSKVFGDHQIEFANQNLKLKGFFNPDDDNLSIRYSSDIIGYWPEHQVVISQYKDKVSPLELLNKEVLNYVESYYDAKYIKSYNVKNDYFIIFSEFNGDTSAQLHFVKIFEKDGRTYKISYERQVTDNAQNVSKTWVDEGHRELVDDAKDIDAFVGIDLSYANKVFNDSLKIKNSLSKSNIYNYIKWETKIIKENNAHADINLEYPEFKGFSASSDLNKIVKDVIWDTLNRDKKTVNEWLSGNLPEKSDFDLCNRDLDYDYECSVNLSSSFKVKSIINDIISIEIILTDYTGGGNGNHSYLNNIIYDLKNRKQLYLDDLFCGDAYVDRVKDVLLANLAIGPIYENSLEYLGDEVVLSSLEQASFSDLGLTVSFDPYTYTPGSYGIYDIFIPYSLIKDNVCFNGSSNNEILIKRNILSLDVPANLSDSCGFMADDCEAFSFYEGKFNEPGSYDFTRDKAYILTSFNDYKTGNLLENKGYTQIILVPYTWVWASSGNGLYVIKKNGNNLDIVSRIDVGKRPPENLKIENNKISFNSTNLDGSDNSQECYFKDNKLEEKNLVCK